MLFGQKFEAVLWPKREFDKFYTGDSYVILSVSLDMCFYLFYQADVEIQIFYQPIDERNKWSFFT